MWWWGTSRKPTASTGISFAGSGHTVQGNLSHANGSNGISFSGTGHQILRNSLIGNQQFGIIVAAGGSGTITGNNIYGNNDDPSSGSSNCGLLNQPGGALTAAGNFWGLSSGPGVDPADNVCDDGAGSVTTATPLGPKRPK